MAFEPLSVTAVHVLPGEVRSIAGRVGREMEAVPLLVPRSALAFGLRPDLPLPLFFLPVLFLEFPPTPLTG